MRRLATRAKHPCPSTSRPTRFGSSKRSTNIADSSARQTSCLDRKLDTTLLERNPLKLTETGIRLLHYAEAVLGEEAQVWRDISNIKNGVLGSLLLATSSTVNALYGETLIMAFLEEAPSPGSRST